MLELAILLGELLDRVICEVDHLVLQILGRVCVGRGPDVAFGVPVGLQSRVLRGEQHVATKVELPFAIEQGLIDVLLSTVIAVHDVSLRITVPVVLLLVYSFSDLILVSVHRDAGTLVRALSWLQDVNVLGICADWRQILPHLLLPEVGLEFLKLWVLDAVFNMEGHRHVVPDAFLLV